MKKNKISLKNGYTLTINEDDTLVLTVESFEGETLEFDGIKGNLMDASDFETHYTDEDIEYTVAEYKYGSLEFLTDWGVDKEVAKAIVEELTPWFERYAIKQPEADAWLKVLEDRVNALEQQKELYGEEVTETAKRFREWVTEADEIDLIYDSESKAHNLNKKKETYTEVCNELRKAKSELWNYKDTMHIA